MSGTESNSTGDDNADNNHGDATPSTLSNQDFKKFLTTPLHPSMKQTGKKQPPPVPGEKKSASLGNATPAAATSAVSSSSSSNQMKYADGEMKTIKFSKHGIEGGDEKGEGGEGEDGDESTGGSESAGHGGKKGTKVLSSRERSYIAFQQKQALKAESKTRYRDRAKERTLGVNPDYVDTGAQIMEDVSVEASKYLGGDIQHTHLVKGLDYALLNKVREEIEREEERKIEELAEQQRQAKVGGSAATAAAASSTAAAPAAVKPVAPTPVSHSASAAAIFSLATAVKETRGTTRFLPGRLTYSFPLQRQSSMGDGVRGLADAIHHASALPSAQVTSAADLATAQAQWAEEHVQTRLPNELWQKVHGLFERKREEEEERRRRRKLSAKDSGGYNVTKEDHLNSQPNEDHDMITHEPMPKLEPAGARTAASSSSAASASVAAASTSAPMELDYSVPRPPPSQDDSDDDDIFAGAGSNYVAQVEPDQPMYDVPRPPPSDDDEEMAPAPSTVVRPPATAKPLSSSDPSIRQLDKHASRIVDESPSDEDDDIFVSDTLAGDEILKGTGVDEKNLTADQKKKRKAEALAEEEYAELFPSHHTAYSNVLDDDEELDPSYSGLRAAKSALEEDAANAAKLAGGKGGKGGKTPFHRGGGGSQMNEEKQREAKFNAEFSQVSAMLQQRGVKLNDDQRRRQTNKDKEIDDERAMKRMKILKGFAKTK